MSDAREPGSPESEEEPGSLRATASMPPPPSSKHAKSFGKGARVLLALATLTILGVAGRELVASLHPKPIAAATPATATAPLPVTVASDAVPAPRADRELNREGKTFCAGGTLVVLPDFASADGAYDLVVHLHGATDLVTQSFGAVKLNAVAIVFNLGISSGAYEQSFGYGPMFDTMLDEVKSALAKRGLKDPKLRRLALSAFSAGFGGVERILSRPGMVDMVDSVMLYDGLHTPFETTGYRKPDARPIDPFLKFAELAASGKKLFFITHSKIPTYEYASTTETSEVLLKSVGLVATAGGDTPAMPDLPAMGSAVAKKNQRPLIPVSHAEKNGLFVRGFEGMKPEDHLAHLMQMATTALPELAKRWR